MITNTPIRMAGYAHCQVRRGAGLLKQWTLLPLTLAVIVAHTNRPVKGEVVRLAKHEQQKALLLAQQTCLLSMSPVSLKEDRLLADQHHRSNGAHCNMTWDGIGCWGETPAGTVASMTCPSYIDGFDTQEVATRTCLADGTWYVNPAYNRTWTNYTLCVSQNSGLGGGLTLMEKHVWRIKVLYNVGYGISLGSLIIAVLIMLYFKKLHCPRNTLHVHLFISFILRATISFVKENVLVQGLGLPQDVNVDAEGHVHFIEEGTHWECKLLMCVFMYVIGANYIWIFVEALYLHMIIFVSVFSDRKSVLPYVLVGWALPLAFVGPWIAVRITMEDVLCWNTHPTRAYSWIIRGPIVATVVVNFLFFINIVRFLFIKLQATNSPETKKYRKLAKSTLVLIPLFGVHYIIFIGLPDNVNPTVELVKLYFEMLFNSFQGFFVALLFCFFNSEVQNELRKSYYRAKLRRRPMGFHSHRNNTSTYVTWARSSAYGTPMTVVERAGSIPNQEFNLDEIKFKNNI